MTLGIGSIIFKTQTMKHSTAIGIGSLSPISTHNPALLGGLEEKRVEAYFTAPKFQLGQP